MHDGAPPTITVASPGRVRQVPRPTHGLGRTHRPAGLGPGRHLNARAMPMASGRGRSSVGGWTRPRAPGILHFAD